jgi:hypothetical protein
VGGKPDALSYAQYHSLEKGMTAAAILKAFGPPAHTLEQDGKVRGLTYFCEDAAGKAQQLRMVFDGDGRLEKWALTSGEAAPKREEPAEKTS